MSHHRSRLFDLPGTHSEPVALAQLVFSFVGGGGMHYVHFLCVWFLFVWLGLVYFDFTHFLTLSVYDYDTSVDRQAAEGRA